MPITSLAAVWTEVWAGMCTWVLVAVWAGEEAEYGDGCGCGVCVWGRGISRRVLCYFSASPGSAKGPSPHPYLHACPQPCSPLCPHSTIPLPTSLHRCPHPCPHHMCPYPWRTPACTPTHDPLHCPHHIPLPQTPPHTLTHVGAIIGTNFAGTTTPSSSTTNPCLCTPCSAAPAFFNEMSMFRTCSDRLCSCSHMGATQACITLCIVVKSQPATESIRNPLGVGDQWSVSID